MINHAFEFMLIGLIIIVFGTVMVLTKNLAVAWVGTGFVALGGVIALTFLYTFIFTSISSLPDGEESKEITIGNVSMSCEEIMEEPDKMIRDHCEGDELHRQDVERKR